MALTKFKNIVKYARAFKVWDMQEKCYSQFSSAVPEIPPFDYTPQPYKGPGYEQLEKLKKDHAIQCFRQYYKKPLLICEGKMQWLFDQNGKRYLDMFAGIVTVSVGHCHPKVNEALKTQLDKLWHTTNIYTHPKLYEYAVALVKKFPGKLKCVYFVNSGSEANDLAMLMARIHTKNFDIISFRNAYHGGSSSAMGITAHSTWKFEIPVMHGVHHAMNPDVYRGIWGGSNCRDSPVQTERKCDCSDGKCKATENYYNQLEEIFLYSLPRGKVAGLFAESIQGVGGVVQYPKGFLKKAQELVRTNGGLFIADEVQSGFGRLGEHFWGFESHEIVPDIVTIAKGIGNGFPLAAVVTTPKIADSLHQAIHFNTYGGNPLACTVGMAVLEAIEEDGLQKNSTKVGTYLLKKLAELRDEFDFVGDVRGKGLMIGIELVTDKVTKRSFPSKHFETIWEDTKDMGLLVGRGGLRANVIRLKPPMCVTIEDADFTVAVLRRSFQRYKSQQSNLP